VGDMREINALINRMRDTDLSTRRHAIAHELRHAVAALDAAEARAVVVRELVWHEDPDNDGDSCFWRAKAGDYIYEVGADLSYWWQLDGDISTCAINGFKTPDLAKAAAQADYDTRILSALHPASPLGAVAMKAAAVNAVRLNAWAHQGTDSYSTGMDAGARHQSKVDVAAIEALPLPTDAELLAAAAELPEVRALVKASRQINKDWDGEPEDMADLSAALAPFARKGE